MLAAVVLVWAAMTNHGLAAIADNGVLTLVTAAVAALAGTRALSSLAVLLSAVRWRDWTIALAALVASTTSLGGSYVAYDKLDTVRQAYAVFPEVGGMPARPTPTPDTDARNVPSALSSTTVGEATATEDTVAADRYLTVLLIGGDAGEGRWGVRTDSINLLGMNPATGDSYLIGIPRNIQPAPVPPSLTERFPDGFDNLINAAYQWGEANPELTPDPSNPGGSLLKAIVAELTGVTVQYYLRVDMAGFVELVDAVGGVTVDNLQTAPLSRLPGDFTSIPANLERGVQRLDGRLALAYSRSRAADSDYQRMARQRCVIAGLALQIRDHLDLRTAEAVADMVARNARTDLPRDMLPVFLSALTNLDPATVRSLPLTPPRFSSWPDITAMRAAVTELVTPGLSANGTTTPDTTDGTEPEPDGITTGLSSIGDGSGRDICRAPMP